jgi:hypothetical protein
MAAVERPLDVVVVTIVYKAGEAIDGWAHSIAEAWTRVPEPARQSLRALVVDNGSRPDGRRAAGHGDWIELVKLPENRGFAAGCNAALVQVAGDPLIVILNPDVRLDERFFDDLRKLEWPPDLAAVGPRVLKADGTVEPSARRFPRARTGLLGRTTLLSRMFRSSAPVRRELLAPSIESAQQVDWISGACIVAPMASFRRVGLFDEGFFIYWEDADWCRRARELRMRVEYHPALRVRHVQGTGGSSADRARMVIEFHRSALRYYERHVSRTPFTALAARAALAVRCRMKLMALRTRTVLKADGSRIVSTRRPRRSLSRETSGPMADHKG